MKTSHREVRVMEREQLIQIWDCPDTMLPDGTPGVLWRGAPYRLLAGDRIDIAQAEHPTSFPSQSCAMIQDDEMPWVLVPGTEARLQEIRRQLEGAGVRVRRTGRWLGDDAGSAVYDWFICCEALPNLELIANLLQYSAIPVDDAALARLHALRRHADRLRAALRPATPMDSQSREDGAPVPEIEAPAALEKGPGSAQELAEALGQIEALTAELEMARARPPVALPAAALRFVEELKSLLAATRPDVALLRDSWQVLAGEFAERDGFWRAVGELPADGARPTGWKSLHGAEKVWERHVSNGRDNTGRAYARFDTGARRWGILLGWKGEQDQDIAWLKRQR
jgi:hypothetical protein